MSSQTVPSAALLDANKRLLQLRASRQAACPSSMGDRLSPCADELPWHLAGGQAQPSPQRIFLSGLESSAVLPAHLGWGSEPLSTAMRAIQARQIASAASEKLLSQDIEFNLAPVPAKRSLPAQNQAGTLKVYPDIAFGMLRQEQAAAGRLWLLLRHLDGAGCGVLRVVNLRETLTTPKTALHLCGWRQLRNLLRQGEGIFWQRDKERIWLRSAGKVAAALGVMQLNGRPVAIPVKHLLGSIGEARAYLYASYHAGRQPAGEGRARQKPIARETLTALTGLSAESQRGYERRAGVYVSQNYALGERIQARGREERIWQQGGGAFEFVDHLGGQGRPGTRYMAWQLPNSYTASLAHRPKGRQKRINRTLADLFMQGMTGNEQQALEKRYFGDGAGAVKAVAKRKRDAGEVYWLQNGSGNGRLRLWHVLAASNG